MRNCLKSSLTLLPRIHRLLIFSASNTIRGPPLSAKDIFCAQPLHNHNRMLYVRQRPLLTIANRLVASMSTYKGSTPSAIDPRVVDFYSNFYRVSDDPSEKAHTEYADSITKDGTLIMGTRKATGYDKILELRKGLWTGPIKTRKHTLKQIFPFGEDNMNVMLHGEVDYGLKNGKDVNVEWAGRALLVEDGGKLKMKEYQVYLDSAPVLNATKD